MNDTGETVRLPTRKARFAREARVGWPRSPLLFLSFPACRSPRGRLVHSRWSPVDTPLQLPP